MIMISSKFSTLSSVSFMKLLLSLLLLNFEGYHTSGTQCTGECCYYYQLFPGNLTCNPQGRPKPVILGCGIHSPNGSDVTVRWYRSTQEHLARVQGELVTNGYNVDTIGRLIPFRGLISSYWNRIIENFNESLNGFYWCQIEVNNTCLQPSPYGHIIFNSSSEGNCSSDNSIIHSPVQPLCATAINDSSPQCSHEPHRNATITIQSTITIQPTIVRKQVTLTTHTMVMQVTPTRDYFTSSSLILYPRITSSFSTSPQKQSSSLVYGIIGFLVFITSMLAAALTLMVTVCVSQRRMKSNDLLELQTLVHHQSTTSLFEDETTRENMSGFEGASSNHQGVMISGQGNGEYTSLNTASAEYETVYAESTNSRMVNGGRVERQVAGTGRNARPGGDYATIDTNKLNTPNEYASFQ